VDQLDRARAVAAANELAELQAAAKFNSYEAHERERQQMQMSPAVSRRVGVMWCVYHRWPLPLRTRSSAGPQPVWVSVSQESGS